VLGARLTFRSGRDQKPFLDEEWLEEQEESDD
jgi:hypothetical protein